MKIKKHKVMYEIHIEDSKGELNTFVFKPNSVQNLMVFITDILAEDIGDCKGRAWCGTCMIQQLKGDYKKAKTEDEDHILRNYPNILNTRLACQVFLTEDLHNTTWKVLDSRQFM